MLAPRSVTGTAETWRGAKETERRHDCGLRTSLSDGVVGRSDGNISRLELRKETRKKEWRAKRRSYIDEQPPSPGAVPQ
jgi:hypothetical protein